MAFSCTRMGLGPLALVLVIGLAGCVSQPKNLYGWDGYQPQLYSYLKANDDGNWDEQLLAMRTSQQTILERGEALPPGFHAHMGVLLSRTGQDQAALAEFAEEQRLFPEAGPFMGFLSRTLTVQSKNEGP